jgi:hypothetical protein
MEHMGSIKDLLSLRSLRPDADPGAISPVAVTFFDPAHHIQHGPRAVAAAAGDKC